MPVRNDYCMTVSTILALPCSLEAHPEKPSTVSTTLDVKRNQQRGISHYRNEPQKRPKVGIAFESMINFNQ